MSRKRGNIIAVAHSMRGGAGAGRHTQRRENLGRRFQKHKGSWLEDQDPMDEDEEGEPSCESVECNREVRRETGHVQRSDLQDDSLAGTGSNVLKIQHGDASSSSGNE